MTLIDFICIAVLAVFVIVAAVRGFAKIVLHFLAYIAAGLGARYAAIPLSDLIYKLALHEPIHEKLLQLFPSGSIGGSIEAVMQAIRIPFPNPRIISHRFCICCRMKTASANRFIPWKPLRKRSCSRLLQKSF